MGESHSILSVKDLHISFDEFVAVNNISFDIKKGETLAVVGESGSGKSLTALAIMSLLPKNAVVKGELVFNGPVSKGKDIAMIFQEPMSSLNPVMKIGEQVAEAIILHQQVSKHEARQKTIEWLAKVQLPEPGKIYERYPHQLSGGQKQRVMIAMAMSNKPTLLIADEPTTALDVTVQKEIMQLMHDLQQEQGTAMIFITHDLALASEIADNILVMYKGDAIEYGCAEQVLQHPRHDYAKALVACRPSPEQKGKRLPTVTDFLSADSKPFEEVPNPSPETGEILLEVNKLKIWFEAERNWLGKTLSYYKAVDDVSFNLHKGEVLGLVGESGCGKSTLSKSLIGLLPIKEGQVIYNDEDLAQLPAKEWTRIRRQIQMIFQDPYGSLNPRMTIGDMLMEPMRAHSIVSKSELKKEAQRLLDLVHLPADSLKRYPHQFSGGQRQRLGIARALSLRPQLIVCDESVSALDVSVQAQILNLLKELQQEFQLTYLFISHDLNVVHYISDRVMVMQAGHIVESGEAEQVLKQPLNDYTKRLIDAMPKMA